MYVHIDLHIYTTYIPHIYIYIYIYITPGVRAVRTKRQSEQPLHFRGITLVSRKQQISDKSFVVIINVRQLDELKQKAWKGGQDLMVLHLRPCW